MIKPFFLTQNQNKITLNVGAGKVNFGLHPLNNLIKAIQIAAETQGLIN